MRIISYNILAPSYARPDRYPYTDTSLLAWEARRGRLLSRLCRSDADVLCLQEVEEYVYRYLAAGLEGAGYSGICAQKRHGRPDGCATFYRLDRLQLASSHAIHYRDAEDAEMPHTGHLALTTVFDVDGLTLNVVNTHIRWDEPDLRGRRHVGFRQVEELLDTCSRQCADRCVICGDFNAEPDTDLVQQMVSSGFIDAYAKAPQPTANSECRAKRIDYIFHSTSSKSVPTPLPEIDDQTPLPSDTEPSDHLQIGVDLTFD